MRRASLGLMLALVTVLVAIVGVAPTTSADEVVDGYDGTAGTHVADHEGVGPDTASSLELAASAEVVVSRRADAEGTSTTSGPLFVAPQTVRPGDLVESPLWTSTKNQTSAQNALRHFDDHGAQFPDVTNATEYVAKAQDFLRTPPGGTLTRVRSNGDVVRYHPGSNTFGVMDASGAPRTLFRPDPSVHGHATNLDYFYAQ